MAKSTDDTTSSLSSEGGSDMQFDPNIILDWQTKLQKGDKKLEFHMPVCQGTARCGIEYGLLTEGVPSMEGNEVRSAVVNEDGVTVVEQPASPNGGTTGGSSTVVGGGAVPRSPRATAASDSDDDDSLDGLEDVFDNPEQAIRRLLEELKFAYQVKVRRDEDSGDYEVSGWAAPSDGDAGGLVPSPRITAGEDEFEAVGQGGQIVMSSATVEKMTSSAGEDGLPEQLRMPPLATQLTTGAGNTVLSNQTKIDDIKQNGLSNVIGFLAQFAIAAQLNVVVNIAPGAGADTST